MHTRLAALLAAVAVSATVSAADSRQRDWPYFRSAGAVVQPGKPLPDGLSLTNASLELRLVTDHARQTSYTTYASDCALDGPGTQPSPPYCHEVSSDDILYGDAMDRMLSPPRGV